MRRTRKEFVYLQGQNMDRGKSVWLGRLLPFSGGNNHKYNREWILTKRQEIKDKTKPGPPASLESKSKPTQLFYFKSTEKSFDPLFSDARVHLGSREDGSVWQISVSKEEIFVPVLGLASTLKRWKLEPGSGWSWSLAQSGFGFSQWIFWSFWNSFTNLSPVWLLDSGSVLYWFLSGLFPELRRFHRSFLVRETRFHRDDQGGDWGAARHRLELTWKREGDINLTTNPEVSSSGLFRPFWANVWIL